MAAVSIDVLPLTLSCYLTSLGKGNTNSNAQPYLEFEQKLTGKVGEPVLLWWWDPFKEKQGFFKKSVTWRERHMLAVLKDDKLQYVRQDDMVVCGLSVDTYEDSIRPHSTVGGPFIESSSARFEAEFLFVGFEPVYEWLLKHQPMDNLKRILYYRLQQLGSVPHRTIV